VKNDTTALALTSKTRIGVHGPHYICPSLFTKCFVISEAVVAKFNDFLA